MDLIESEVAPYRNTCYNYSFFISTFLPELQRIKQSPMKLGQVFIDNVSS